MNTLNVQNAKYTFGRTNVRTKKQAAFPSSIAVTLVFACTTLALSEGDRLSTTAVLQAGRLFPIAKPEVAALHWLYLARSPRSSKREAPQDIDFSVLDLDLLNSLAKCWDLSRSLQE